MSIAAVIHRASDRAQRREFDAPGTLRTGDGRPVDLTIDDLSASGFHISTDLALTPGEIVTIGIPGIRTHRAEVVRATAAGFGCRFLAPIGEDVHRAHRGRRGTAQLIARHVRREMKPTARKLFTFAAQDAGETVASYYKLSRQLRLFVLVVAAFVCWLPLVILYRLLA